MSVKVGSFTPAFTGNVTVDNLTFLPTNLILRVGNSSSSTITTVARGDGWCTANNQNYDATYVDTANNRMSQKSGTDRTLRVEKWDSGTSSMVDALSCTFVDFHDNGGGNYGFTLNFTATDSRQIRYRATDQ